MNYFEKQEMEQRSEPRKMLRCRATVVGNAFGAIAGQTIDISSKGLSIMLPMDIEKGTPVQVAFKVWQGSDLLSVSINARVVNTICVGTQGFRTGFEMLAMDQKNKAAVKRLVGDTT